MSIDKGIAERLKEEMLARSMGKAAKVKAAVVEEVKEELFVETDENMKDKITYSAVWGEDHPYSEYYFDTGIKKEEEDWPEIMRQYIPEIDSSFQVNPEYGLSLLIALEGNYLITAKGKPGTGKDKHIEQLCALLKWPYIRRDGAENKEISDEIGFPVVAGGTMSWSDGPLALFARHGGVYVSSEPFVNSAGVNMGLQSLKEGSRILNLLGHPVASEAQIKANKDFRLFETSNVRGTGDGSSQYAATTVQDVSSLNRTDIHCIVDYLPPEKEVEIIIKAYPTIAKTAASKMVKMGNLIRRGWDEGQFEMPFSMRQLLRWADLSSKTKRVDEAFRMVYLRACNDDEQGAIKGLWEAVDFGVSL